MSSKYLNIGCGKRFHKEWTNIDIAPTEPEVIPMNILKRLKFADESFDAVYHSHVLEHIPRHMVHEFISECRRVLRTGGILRIAIPDMESIVRNYLKFLEENISNESIISAANYEWTLIELYDQMVRNESGGEMKKYLLRDNLPNKDFIRSRSADAALHMDKKTQGSGMTRWQKFRRMRFGVKMYLIFGTIRSLIFGKILPGKKYYRTGMFRLGGEIHYWMYDRYSLPKLLKECGFKQVEVKSASESNIAEWNKFELDTQNGKTYKPDSLFVEARK